jgi:hypothetical protein
MSGPLTCHLKSVVKLSFSTGRSAIHHLSSGAGSCRHASPHNVNISSFILFRAAALACFKDSVVFRLLPVPTPQARTVCGGQIGESARAPSPRKAIDNMRKGRVFVYIKTNLPMGFINKIEFK